MDDFDEITVASCWRCQRMSDDFNGCSLDLAESQLHDDEAFHCEHFKSRADPVSDDEQPGWLADPERGRDPERGCDDLDELPQFFRPPALQHHEGHR